MRAGGMRGKALLVGLCCIALVVGGLSWNPVSSRAASPIPKLSTVDLPGVSGSVNNLSFVFDRWALVAPFAPSGNPAEDAGLEEYDNHFLYLIDTKKPDAQYARSLRNCYYPTKLVYDSNSNTAFVRGTEFVDLGGGNYEPREVISYITVDRDSTTGDPKFTSEAVSFEIKGRGTDFCSDAPTDFVLGQGGRILVFTNGFSIFTYTLAEGYLYEVGFFKVDDEYGPDNRITSLDYDDQTGTLSVSLARKTLDSDGVPRYSYELKFYSLNPNGSVDLITQVVSSASSLDRDPLAPNSNVVISSDPDNSSNEFFGLFISNDGSLCKVDLRNRGTSASVDIIDHFPELMRTDEDEGGTRLLRFDRATKLLSGVKRGHTISIRRPVSSKPGRIRRPVSIHVAGDPALVLAQLNNKKNRIVREKIFATEFVDELGLSNLVFNPDYQQALVSTFTGKLVSIGLSQGVDGASLTWLGDIGERVGYLAYNSNRSTVLAISSYDPTDDGSEISDPGALVVAKVPLGGDSTAASRLLNVLLSPAAGLLPRQPSIKRPCGLRAK
jgi:hypothetical protein